MKFQPDERESIKRELPRDASSLARYIKIWLTMKRRPAKKRAAAFEGPREVSQARISLPLCTPALYTSHKALVTSQADVWLRNVQTIVSPISLRPLGTCGLRGENAARIFGARRTFNSREPIVQTRRNEFNRGSPPITGCRAVSRNKERPRYRGETASNSLSTPSCRTYLHCRDIKSVSRRTHRVSLSLSFSRGHDSQRSLFIFVQFGAQDNALVTDRQVWTKCPSRHSIGPRGYSSSLRPCCSGKAERGTGPSRRKTGSLAFSTPDESISRCNQPRPLPSLPSSVRPYCKHFVLPIDVCIYRHVVPNDC